MRRMWHYSTLPRDGSTLRHPRVFGFNEQRAISVECLIVLDMPWSGEPDHTKTKTKEWFLRALMIRDIKSLVVLPARLGNTVRFFHVRGCECQECCLAYTKQTEKINRHAGVIPCSKDRATVKNKNSRTPPLRTLVIWIGLALPVNLSRILQN